METRRTTQKDAAYPLEAVAGYTDYGYHGISGFVDHDTAYPDSLEDYECGTRTYDTAGGYNHAGVDFFLWPLTWNNMDAGVVQIVAGAAGTIINKHDGEFDRSCSSNSNPWNAVYVQHADGSIAWYGHMKKDSVTAKSVGSSVAQGEVLGLVGSSGNSSGPHLHFELYDSGSNLVDPYSGACNVITSWWASQRPYYDSAINKLSTGSATPTISLCDGPEEPMIKTVFAPGETIYLTAYYRDQLSGQSSTYTVHRPDDSVFSAWNHSSPEPYYAASYWYWSIALPTDAPKGTWLFEIVYEGDTYEQSFEVQVARVPVLGPQALLVLCTAMLAVGLWHTRSAARRW